MNENLTDVLSCSCGCNEFTTIGGCELSIMIKNNKRIVNNIKILDDIHDRALFCKDCGAKIDTIHTTLPQESNPIKNNDVVKNILLDIFTVNNGENSIRDIVITSNALLRDYVRTVDFVITNQDDTTVHYVGELYNSDFVTDLVSKLAEESIKKQLLYKIGFKNSIEESENRSLIIEFLMGNKSNILYSANYDFFFVIFSINDEEVSDGE